MPNTNTLRATLGTQVARSQVINIDNGAGTTLDFTILKHNQPIEITAARIVYTSETSGTVAAGNVKLGSTVGGDEYVAATAYENTKAVGYYKDLTLTAACASIAADTAILGRHTGVASTAAGEVYIEIEYVTIAQ